MTEQIKPDGTPVKNPIKYPIRPGYTNPNYRFICQVFRDIYRLTDDKNIHELCNEGHDMAHRMAHKLVDSYNIHMGTIVDGAKIK